MLTSLGVAGLLGIIGTFAAVLWTVVLAAGGAPGAALTRLGSRGLVIRFVEGFLSTRPAPAWPLWIVGWYLASAPVLFGARHSRCRGAGRHGHCVRVCPAGGGGRVLGIRPVAAGDGAGVGMAAGDSALG